MKANKITAKERERLIQLLTTKYNIDELNELSILLQKDGCKIKILPLSDPNISFCSCKKYTGEYRDMAMRCIMCNKEVKKN